MARRLHRNLMLVLSVLLIGGALAALVVTSFTDALVYFYTPSELLGKTAELEGRRIRLGGMVQEGSLVRTEGTMKIHFLVTDGTQRVPVRYEGVLPDLFREGQGVVAEGVWHDGQPLDAGTILAKHSEDYMPVEMSEEGVQRARESMLKSLQ
ncbi:MAG: cytochrome c maturation protein CcmE [Magnetococcus sp. WYHC-3]